ncbi:MAG TPA: MMPL family transporter, partial [Jatrophihabitans sp.]|nr:MMPL family transporter [Jatrophihabitans sp.]
MLSKIARISVHHRRLVLAAWAGLFLIGIAVGGTVFSHLRDGNGSSSSAESVVGFRKLDAASRHGLPMLVLVDDNRVDNPSTVAGIARTAQQLQRQHWVDSVTTAYSSHDPRLRSKDGTATLIVVVTHKTDDMAAARERVDVTRRILDQNVQTATTKIGGQLAVMAESMKSSADDLMRGELIALPILLAALVIIFRGVRAALMPVLSALVTVAGALLILLVATHLVDVSSYAVDVIAL